MYNKLQTLTLSPLARDPLDARTNVDKIFQTGLKLALVDKCRFAAFVLTFTLGLAVGLGFFQLRVHSAIPYLHPLATDVKFENSIHQSLPRMTFTFLLFSIDYSVFRNRSEQFFFSTAIFTLGCFG